MLRVVPYVPWVVVALDDDKTGPNKPDVARSDLGGERVPVAPGADEVAEVLVLDCNVLDDYRMFVLVAIPPLV